MDLSRLVPSLDSFLQVFFTEKKQVSERISPASGQLVDAIAGLTLRGGKRLRPTVVASAYYATHLKHASQSNPLGEMDLATYRDDTDSLCAPLSNRNKSAWDSIICVGAALELLQTYLLIHDDWMDGDETRRGGPAVHALFRDQLRHTHLGASLAVLAGDLACMYAWELMLQCAVSPASQTRLLRAFGAMQEHVVFGQQLDLLGTLDASQSSLCSASDSLQERVEHLKTGSYTVAGPMRLGGMLADATEEELTFFSSISEPLGVAFQLKDDLLGTFGDASVVGKPVGNDLRAGKHTSIIRAMRHLVPEAAARHTVENVLGSAEAKEEAIVQAALFLDACGAKSAVEKRLSDLVSHAQTLISESGWPKASQAVWMDLVVTLTQRDK